MIGNLENKEQVLCEKKELITLAEQDSIRNPYSESEKKSIKSNLKELNDLMTQQAEQIKELDGQLKTLSEKTQERERERPV